MIGAIVGDIVGDIYEFDNIKTKDFPLFGRENSFTDDTVNSLCAAKALVPKYDSDGCADFTAPPFRASWGAIFFELKKKRRKKFNRLNFSTRAAHDPPAH